jgi:hypothetical protein
VKSVLFYPGPTSFRFGGEMVADASGAGMILYLGWALSPVIAKSVETIGDGSFMENKTLEGVVFKADSGFQRIGELLCPFVNLKQIIELLGSVRALSLMPFALQIAFLPFSFLSERRYGSSEVKQGRR